MAPRDAGWRRLARHIADRRTQLDMTQGDVRAAGGPSTATMRALERGEQASYRPAILASLERALHWQPGSVAAVLAGREPTPIETTTSATQARDSMAMTVAAIDDEAIASVMRNPRVPDDEKRRLVELLLQLRREDQQRRAILAQELTRQWRNGRTA